MALTPKMIKFQQLAAAKADIYAPSGVRGHVHNILLCNNDTSGRTVTLYYHDGSNEYVLYKNMALAAAESVQLTFPGEGLIVEDGDKITGNADAATQVTFYAAGSEV